MLTINIPFNSFNNEAINEFCYINNEDFNISKYTSIKGLKKDLVPLVFNGEVFNNNIITILDKIFRSIFS